jgi:hypothetical protein
MKKCNSRLKHTCGSTNYATCIHTEGEVNTDSELFEVECTNLQENLDDVYNQLDNLDLSALGDLCLSYTTVGGKNIVKNVLLKFEEKICELENRVEELETVNICNQNITACNLEFGSLTTECGDQPTTLAEALQIILDTLNTP